MTTQQQPARRTEADQAYTDGYRTAAMHASGRASLLTGAASEGTKIEQARSAAEVLAMVHAAQSAPRSINAAVEEMREVCARKSLAERAFYRYNRGDGMVTGESIVLAKELARIWHHVDHGVVELSRDDVAGRSEMMAVAWDMQTNTRSRNVFIVPHSKDTRTEKRKPLIDLRDIYENNANMGARRLRECIFSVVPRWFVEEAKDVLHKTLSAEHDGKPRQVVIADAVKAFDARGVTRDQLETKLGRKADHWTDPDLTTLAVVLKSLDRGEVTVEEEFPDERVTVAEITTPRGSQVASNTRPRGSNGRTRSDALDETGPTAEDIAAMNDEANADPQNAKK